MIRFTSRLTPGAYFRLLLAGTLATPVLVLVGLVLLLIGGYTFWSFLDAFGSLAPAVIFGVAAMLFMLAFLAMLFALVAGLQVLLGKNRNLYVPVDVEADDDGLATRSELGEGRVRWAAFVRVRRIGPHVLLYQTSRTFFALGGDEVPEETLQALESLAREKTSR